MKLNGLRQIIKEELAKALNENQPKFKAGDKFTYMGQRFLVLKDDGFSVEARMDNEKGAVKRFNYNQLKGKLTEGETPSYLKDLTPGDYQVEYKYRDQYGDISRIEGKFSVSQEQIDQSPNLSLQNFLSSPAGDVLAVYNLNKL